MSATAILLIIAIYFIAIFSISFFTRKSNDNNSFFLGSRKSPWQIVAFGMIGASLSGISFVSVPGMVANSGFYYMQVVLGFSLGYIVVAKLLLPIYYKLNLTSIYEYLNIRFGNASFKTGTYFFLLSRALGGAARLYIAAIILQNFVFDKFNIPFYITAIIIIALIYLYTFINGIKTIIYTDALQTFFLLSALVLLLIDASTHSSITELPKYEWLNFNFHDKTNFFKMVLSGIFITVAMTGLDQDMMQKNLSCKSLKESQKNMYSYGFAFIPINLAFLFLGAYLINIFINTGTEIPANTDNILPLAVSGGYLSSAAVILFIIGIISATFSSADSTLVSLTTAFSVGILNINNKSEQKAKRTRQIVHFCTCALFVALMIAFDNIDNRNIIDVLFKIASYTYGPLLGLFGFGLFIQRQLKDKFVPLIAIISPIICYIIQELSSNYFGYELLIINGLITFALLFTISASQDKQLNTTKL